MERAYVALRALKDDDRHGHAAQTPTDEIGIGSVLDGRYRLDAVLGTGGMGSVYRAEHLGIGRAVAVKVLHTELGGNREAAQRFQREALASGRLDHPNIVSVSDFGVLDDGSCYLVMEALDGESLGARLARDVALPWPTAVEIMVGILRGLGHAHARGVVHRDIKPDNVFLAVKDGETVVKLLDFGIAKLFAGNADDPATTRAGITVGTPAYLSPEQAVGGEITPASDLYSASVVLFEMLAGRAPFDEREPVAIMVSHISKQPPLLCEVAPQLQLPVGLEAIVQRGLQKFAADRIASAEDYLGLLDGILAAEGLAPALAPYAGAAVRRDSRPIAIPTPSPTSEAVAVARISRPLDVPSAVGATRSSEVVAASPVRRATSIADVTEPLPRRWYVAGLAVVGGACVLAIVLAIVSRTTGYDTVAPADAGVRATRPTIAAPVEVEASVVPPAASALGRDVTLKAALHDLESGATCPDRRAAIAKLVELGDERAVPALRAARYRMRGGVLGFHQNNTNACLKAAADEAIKTLGEQAKRKEP